MKTRTMYKDIQNWKEYQTFLPLSMRFTAKDIPTEEWWEWKGLDVHLDRMKNPASPLKIIMLHGGGGNGRLIGALGKIAHSLGYEYVAPDLPGFGLTSTDGFDFEYSSWVKLVADLAVHEYAKDRKPIVLFGASLGGMLAYNVAACTKEIRGIIATTLADPRTAQARDALARNKLWSRLGYFMIRHSPDSFGRINIRAKWISKLAMITNDPAFSKVFMRDRYIGNSLINMKFYKSMSLYNPAIEPDRFSGCPVLLAHPGRDRWTPVEISKQFFDRLPGAKKLVMLEGAGHFPYEEPGISQLKQAVAGYLRKIE